MDAFQELGASGMFVEFLHGSNVIEGDPRVASWPLLAGPGPVRGILLLFIFVVFAGTRVMRSRPPMYLKPIIIPYNFFMVVLSVYMFYEFLVTAILSGYNWLCQPVDYTDSAESLRMASVIWWFFFSKIIELVDTLFFILRKKNNQVSFLHVYHHVTIIFIAYHSAKYAPGGNGFFWSMMNSFVHIWMYLYYGLAAIGPHMQKYLGWKRYLTTLQLVQFFVIVIHTSANTIIDCPYPEAFSNVMFIYSLTLIVLFANYYHKEYVAMRNKRHNKALLHQQ